MSPSVQKAVTDFQTEIGEIARKHKVEGAEWFEYLEEAAGHIECLIDCYKEEHREDFE